MSDFARGSARVISGGKVELRIEVPIVEPAGRTGPGEKVEGPPPPAEPGRATHSPDFAGVNWFGTAYSFTPKQRSIVAALWRAWEEGYGYVGQDSLLELADSDQSKLRDLFRGHPAWGAMIVHAHAAGGPAGAYRLATPGAV